MQPAQPYRGPSRAHRRELQALLGDHPIDCDDKSPTDLLLVETMDLDAAIDAKRLVTFALAGLTAREKPTAAHVSRLGLPTNPPAQVAELRGSKEVYALPPLVVAFAGPADDPHGLAATFQRAPPTPPTPAGQSGTNLRSLLSRLWNWVPGGRVWNTGLYSHRSLTDRRY